MEEERLIWGEMELIIHSAGTHWIGFSPRVLSACLDTQISSLEAKIPQMKMSFTFKNWLTQMQLDKQTKYTQTKLPSSDRRISSYCPQLNPSRCSWILYEAIKIFCKFRLDAILHQFLKLPLTVWPRFLLGKGSPFWIDIWFLMHIAFGQKFGIKT